MPLSATAVGDAQFALYDNGVVSTVDPTFSRDVETVNGLGEIVAADERRFGEPVAYSPTVDWSTVEVDFLPFDRSDIKAEVMATGWDHDGVTPLMVLKTSGFRTELLVVRGEDFELVNRISYRGSDLLQGAVEDRRYLPEAVVIHHGLVVIALQRSEPEGAGYTPTGVDFVTTQDYGQTLDRVPVVGGGFETPSLPGGVSRGMWRLEGWSFSNAFPVAGIEDTEAAWFPWADYINKLGDPKGGQVGLFRADRDAETGRWNLSPNRVLYDVWESEDTGGFHSHAAAMTEGGIISHWGDVTYRSVSRFHAFDLSDYENSPVTTVDAYGGYQSTPESHQASPQPAATAPSPVLGEHFATGDLTPDNILSYGSLESVGDRLAVRAERYNPERGVAGGVHRGVEVLHINWLQGVGYAVGSRGDPVFYFSPDGESWSEINSPSGSKGTLWLYGERLLAYRSGGLLAAPLPTVDVVRPLQVAPGGENLLAAAPEWMSDLGEGNTARQVTYADGLWRYVESYLPLDVQPAAAPFSSAAPVYELTIGSNDQDLGAIWLQPEGETSDSSQQHLTQMWLANLASQGALFGARHGSRDFDTGVSGFSDTFYLDVSDNRQWTAVGISATTRASATDGVGRFAAVLGVRNSSPGSRFLLATTHFAAIDSPTYPIAPESSGPDELESVGDLDLLDDWSLGLVAHWPEDAPLRVKTRMPIASLTGPSGDAVELAVEHAQSRNQLVVTLFDEGQQVNQEILQLGFGRHFSRDDFLDVVVSKDEQSMGVSFVVSGERPLYTEFEAGWDLDLDAYAWADRIGDVVAATDPVLVAFDDESWDADQHQEWLQGSLTEKALYGSKPSTGDFNSDGLVDNADYSVWRDTLYDNTPGRLGDLNADGEIDGLDGLAWRGQYGATGAGWAADINGDLVVDAADYTLWRDLAEPQLRPGTGADADGNGYVQQEDYLLWQDAYGSSYPTIEGLRAQAGEATATDDPEIALASHPTERLSEAVPLTQGPPSVAPVATPTAPAQGIASAVVQGDQSDLLLYWQWQNAPPSAPQVEGPKAEEEEVEALDAALAEEHNQASALPPLPSFGPL